MKKPLILVLVLFLIIAVSGCGGGGGNGESSNLTVQTIKWQSDGDGYTQYYTNDEENCNSGQLKYNTTFLNTTVSKKEVLIYEEVQLKKISGYSNKGYGILVCYNDSDNYFAIFITEKGRYAIKKKISGVITISDWSSSSDLNQGYNTLNTIKVERANSTDPFIVYFNGTLVTQFDGSKLKYGSYGFYAGVGTSTEESFPNTPVDVRFKLVKATASSSVE